MIIIVISTIIHSALARGGAGEARAPPPQFFTPKVKTDIWNVENKISSPSRSTQLSAE